MYYLSKQDLNPGTHNNDPNKCNYFHLEFDFTVLNMLCNYQKSLHNFHKINYNLNRILIHYHNIPFNNRKYSFKDLKFDYLMNHMTSKSLKMYHHNLDNSNYTLKIIYLNYISNYKLLLC